MFLKIQTEADLPDEKVFLVAQTLRRECGRYCIEPRLEEFIKSYGPAVEEYFSVEELTMKLSHKNPDTKKTEYFDGKRHLVYCNDIDKVCNSKFTNKCTQTNKYCIEKLSPGFTFTLSLCQSTTTQPLLLLFWANPTKQTPNLI